MGWEVIHQVIIHKNTGLVQVEPGSGWSSRLDRVTADADMTNWLRRYVKNGNWSRSTYRGAAGNILGLVYTFKDPEHAMLFKLTWGGI